VAFGSPSPETLALLLENRGETESGETVTDEYIRENTQYDSVEELSEAIINDETTLRDAGIKPRIRLHPPRKGHSGMKHPYKEGGVLGNHGEEIDDLLRRMR
ncbi:MAG: 50S ribosomal protein L30, partial [Halobacteria archaeon]|nr:50S ribosomal protein L30 [Halobacteria archaeon]